MCGRFALTLPMDAVAGLFRATPDAGLTAGLGNLGPRWNVCPTQPVAAVVSEDGVRRLTALRWGFVPHWAKAPTEGPLLINARAETVAEKPAFRAAARARRCLVPADGFYEWRREGRTKRPFWVHPAVPDLDGPVVALAGIWEVWRAPDGTETAAVALITVPAAPPIDAVHHRAPLAIAPEDRALWLGEAGPGAARLMRTAAAGWWALHPVSPAVNSNRADGPDLILPWTPEAPPPLI